MSVVQSTELDYETIELSHSSPQLTKITAQQPLDSVNSITSSGGQESIFEIPAKVVNFGKSFLSYKATPVGGTAGATITNWRHLVPEISQLQLYTRQGLYLCDIVDFQTYWATVGRKETSLDKLMSSDPIDQSNDGFFNWLHKNNTTSDPRPTSSDTTAYTKKVDYLEAKSLIAGTIDTTVGANLATPVLNVNLQFDIPNTIFMNKNQYFGDSVYLRVVWSKSTDVLFTVNNAASGTNPVSATPAAYTGNITISNLVYYLALETNPIVSQLIMQKYMSGTMSYKIDYVYHHTRSLAAATNMNLEVRYNRGQGSKLKKVYWAPLDNTNATNVKYDSSIEDADGDRQKVTSFYITLNSLRLHQYDYESPNTTGTPVLGNEWMAKKDELKGSSILSSNEFYYHYTSLTNFTGVKAHENTANLHDGLDLTQEQLLSWQITTPGTEAVRHVIYGITSRDLVVTSAGITLV